MSQSGKTPVLPVGMELVFIYPCPRCGHTTPRVAPTQLAMTRCDACGTAFTVAPVDERTVHYIKIMLANGRAAVDADFV